MYPPRFAHLLAATVMAAWVIAACGYRDGAAPDVRAGRGWIRAQDIGGTLRTERGSFGPGAATPDRPLRIVTFNVLNGGELDAIVDAFRTNPELARADVVMLQEVERGARDQTSGAHYIARELGMHYVFAPARLRASGEAHGLAVLSRYSIVDARVLRLQQLEVHGGHLQRIALWAQLDVDGSELAVFDVHLDTRVNHTDRIEQLAAVVETATGAMGPVIVGGDMNTNSVTWLRRTYPIGPARQAEAVDAYMIARCFSAPTAASGPTSRDLPLLQHKLDSVFVRGLDVVATGVERSVEVSDHLPVWIDVRWPVSAAPDVFARHRCPQRAARK